MFEDGQRKFTVRMPPLFTSTSPSTSPSLISPLPPIPSLFPDLMPLPCNNSPVHAPCSPLLLAMPSLPVHDKAPFPVQFITAFRPLPGTTWMQLRAASTPPPQRNYMHGCGSLRPDQLLTYTIHCQHGHSPPGCQLAPCSSARLLARALAP